MNDKNPQLTERMLWAMEDALFARIADEEDGEKIGFDYDAAVEWVQHELYRIAAQKKQ